MGGEIAEVIASPVVFVGGWIVTRSSFLLCGSCPVVVALGAELCSAACSPVCLSRHPCCCCMEHNYDVPVGRLVRHAPTM